MSEELRKEMFPNPRNNFQSLQCKSINHCSSKKYEIKKKQKLKGSKTQSCYSPNKYKAKTSV
jgi:hypothetical protein